MKAIRLAAMMAGLVAVGALAAPQVGGVLVPLRLAGDNGGLVAGGGWNSTSMDGKVRVVFYVDPDEKELNEHVGVAIQKAKLDQGHYGSVAIINMGATWLPNFAVARSLKAKQKQYPRTVYVKDLNKTLVKRWGLSDDGYDVMVLDPGGTVLFYGRGLLNKAQTQRVVEILRTAIEQAKQAAAEGK